MTVYVLTHKCLEPDNSLKILSAVVRLNPFVADNVQFRYAVMTLLVTQRPFKALYPSLLLFCLA